MRKAIIAYPSNKVPKAIWGALLSTGAGIVVDTINQDEEEKSRQKQLQILADQKVIEDKATLQNFNTKGTSLDSFYLNDGGMIKTPSYNSNGGNLLPLSSDGEIAKGNTHEQGGIKLSKGNQPVAEIEDDEVVKEGQMVFSDRLKPEGSTKTFAEIAEKLARKKGKYEKELNNGLVHKTKKNTLERSISNIDRRENKLFQEQEIMKHLLDIKTPLTKFAFGGGVDPIEGMGQKRKDQVDAGMNSITANRNLDYGSLDKKYFNVHDQGINYVISPSLQNPQNAQGFKSQLAQLQKLNPNAVFDSQYKHFSSRMAYGGTIEKKDFGGTILSNAFRNLNSFIDASRKPKEDGGGLSGTFKKEKSIGEIEKENPNTDIGTFEEVPGAEVTRLSDGYETEGGTFGTQVVPYLDNALNLLNTITKPKVPAPILTPNAQYNTKVNVTDKIGNVKNAVQRSKEFIRDNTSNSNTARALVIGTNLKGSEQLNSILANRDNQERNLENQALRGNQFNNRLNANTLNQNISQELNRDLSIRKELSQNAANVIDDFYKITQLGDTKYFEEMKTELYRDIYAGNNANLKTRIRLDDPVQRNYWKNNREEFEDLIQTELNRGNLDNATAKELREALKNI